MATRAQLTAAKRAAISQFSVRRYGSVSASVAERADHRMFPDIIGVGIGRDEIRLYAKDSMLVESRLAVSSIRSIDGIPLMVVQTPGFSVGPVPRVRATTSVSIQCGESVGHVNITAGTIGCVVENGYGDRLILSNNHVLADSNDGSIGDSIVHPGPFDGGSPPADTVAVVSAYKPIEFSGTNYIDAAVGEIVDGKHVSSRIRNIGRPSSSVIAAATGQDVQKRGRTTGYTTGTVGATSLDTHVNFGGKQVWFEDQIEITGQGFSRGGDSGSLVLDMDKNPVGLLFAGDDQALTLANPMQVVLDELDLSMA